MEGPTRLTLGYIYKIGYYSPEESAHAELIHERRFTMEELREMVASCTEEAALNVEPHHPVAPSDYTHEWLHDEIVTLMIKRYGFSRVEYDAVVSVAGWQDYGNAEDTWAKDDFSRELHARVRLKLLAAGRIKPPSPRKRQPIPYDDLTGREGDVEMPTAKIIEG